MYGRRQTSGSRTTKSNASNQIISPERKYKNFNDIEAILNEEQKNYISLTDLILTTNVENIQDVYNKIIENSDKIFYLTSFIPLAMRIRPLQKKKFYDLLVLIAKKYGAPTLTGPKPIKFLKEKEILTEYDCFGPMYASASVHSKLPVENIFFTDDVEGFIKTSSEKGFSPKARLDISRNNLIYYVEATARDYYDLVHAPQRSVTLMQVMAYNGAIKCFKYALQDGSYDMTNIAKYAIAGGNKEIINLLQQKGVSFGDCFEVAVKFHRKEICNWLLDNYKCNAYPVKNNAEFCNDLGMYFFLFNGINVTKEALNDTLLWAARSNANPVVKLIAKSGKADIESLSKSKGTPLLIACQRKNYDLAKFLIDQCNADMYKLCENGSLISIAYKQGNIDFVKYLIEEKNYEKDSLDQLFYVVCMKGDLEFLKYLVETSDEKAKENWSEFIFYYACKGGNLDIVKYLTTIEGCYTDEPDENDGKTPFMIAVENGHLEVVKYLNENFELDPNEGFDVEEEEQEEDSEDYYHPHITTNTITKKPLYLALENKHYDIACYLVENCHVDIDTIYEDNNEKMSAFDFALEENNPFALLLKKKRLLIDAISLGDVDLVKYLIESSNINPDFMYKGKSMLELAEGKEEIKAVIQNKINNTRIVIE